MKICHLSSIHHRYDTRVFRRECISIANEGYNIHLLVNDGKDTETKEGVFIKSVFCIRHALFRRLITPLLFLKIILFSNFKIIHFHDPELIPLGLLLRLLGKNVVFDVHENYERYNIKGLKRLYYIYIKFNHYLASLFLELILAEKSYFRLFPHGKNKSIVLNYPNLDFFEHHNIKDIKDNNNHLFYIGAVKKFRGIEEILDALNIVNRRLPELDFFFHIYGPIVGKISHFIDERKYMTIKDKYKFYGYSSQSNAFQIAEKCKLGIALTLPTKNYKESLSTKVFEYMAIGLPQIYSDFEVYDEMKIYETGTAVNPNDVESIADVIISYLTDVSLQEVSFKNSLKAAPHFSWASQYSKISNLYSRLVNTK